MEQQLTIVQEEKLTRKQMIFAENFIRLNFNECAALTASGYKTTSKGMLKNPSVVNYVNRRKEEILNEIGVNSFRVLKELAAIAFCDVRDYYKDGAMINIDNLNENAAKALMCVDVFELYDNEGQKLGETKRLRTHDKLKALDMLARYLNMFEKDNEGRKPELNVYEVTLKLT